MLRTPADLPTIPPVTSLDTFHEELLRLAERARIHGQRTAARSGEDSLSRVAVTDLQRAVEQLQGAEGVMQAQLTALALSTAALETERQRYQALFDFAPDAYLVTDPAGHILEANRAVSRLLSTPRTYVLTKPLRAFIIREDEALLRRQLARLATIAAGSTVQFELHLRPRGPNPALMVAVHAAAAHTSDGSLHSLHWLLRERPGPSRAETSRRRQQQAETTTLRDRLTELDAVVRMRDAELTHERGVRERAAELVSALMAAGSADATALCGLQQLLRSGS